MLAALNSMGLMGWMVEKIANGRAVTSIDKDQPNRVIGYPEQLGKRIGADRVVHGSSPSSKRGHRLPFEASKALLQDHRAT